MVFQILAALLIIGIILALALGALIYIPLLPLLIQAWFVELFGDVDARLTIPILTLFTLAGGTIWASNNTEFTFGKRELQCIVPGVVLLLAGGYLFGGAWESMQTQHLIAKQNANFFSTSTCADFVSTCLIENEGDRPNQLGASIFAELVWYSGLGLYLYGLGYREQLTGT